mmetsp:Transcript_12339/g.30243  ORF Transcript_12339/g.30243 Transcript_12339/m.30243 type:complete len:550 (-) Transcript_12339:49-1698(-)
MSTLAALAFLSLLCLAPLPAGAHTDVEFEGFLVDTWSWNRTGHVGRDGVRLNTSPQEHTVQSMTDFPESRAGGFLLLYQKADSTFDVKYTLDVSGNTAALELLDALKKSDGGARKDVQVVAKGVAHGTPAMLLMAAFTLPGAAGGDHHDHAHGEAEAKLVVGELSSGFVLDTTVDETAKTITIKVQNNKYAWIAFGLTTPGGGMTGGGTGAEVYICTSDGGLKRYWVTKHEKPTGGTAVNNGECMVMDGYVHMAFVLDLADADRRHGGKGPHIEATPGRMQSVIFAYGQIGDTSMAAEHAQMGERSLDLGDLAKGLVTTRRPAQWTLWIHLVFMSLAWGWALPWGAAVAARAKAIIGQPVGEWFKVHTRFQALGWLLSLIGFAFALAHAELFSAHFRTPHTIIGIVAVSLCFLQPFNAFFRPHPSSPNAPKPLPRTVWEVVHKSLGWGAVLLGAANVIVGAKLSLDLGYDAACAGVALGVGCAGMLSAFAYFLLATAAPQNIISRTLVRARGEEAVEVHAAKQDDGLKGPVVWAPAGPAGLGPPGPARL